MSNASSSEARSKFAEALLRQIARQLGRTLELSEDPRTGHLWLRREEREGRYTVRTSICFMSLERIEVRCVWFEGRVWKFDAAWGMVDNCNPRCEGRSSAGFRTPALPVTRRCLGWASGLCELVRTFREVASGLEGSRTLSA